jgi:hypothetical protein
MGHPWILIITQTWATRLRPVRFVVRIPHYAGWQRKGTRDLSTPRMDSQANPFTPLKMTGVKSSELCLSGTPTCERFTKQRRFLRNASQLLGKASEIVIMRDSYSHRNSPIK